MEPARRLGRFRTIVPEGHGIALLATEPASLRSRHGDGSSARSPLPDLCPTDQAAQKRLNAPAKLMARLDRLLAEVERPKG